MVTFANKGRTGNFLFQLATTIGYAHLHEMDFTVPITTFNREWNPIYFPHLAKPLNLERPRKVIPEQQHAYHPIAYDPSFQQMNIVLDGYWQSYKYFDFCRDKVLSIMNIPYNYKPTVSIHVRRGDYLLYPTINPLVQPSFYLEAVWMFLEKGMNHFTVFSDDIQWCKQEFAAPRYPPTCQFDFIEPGNVLEDLSMMSSCEHQIISNSTFAWWGAWLNQNPTKIVICPDEDNYYGPDNKHLDVSTLFPTDWNRIKYIS